MSKTTTEARLVLKAIGDVHQDVRELRKEQQQLRKVANETREQVIRTNGRVTALEKKREELEPLFWSTKKHVDSLEARNVTEDTLDKKAWRSREFFARYGVQLLTLIISFIALLVGLER